MSVLFLLLALALEPPLASQTAQARPIWTPAQAEEWHQAPNNQWLRGANFLPSSAINQIEMWSAPTFDEPTLDRELGYAQSLGFNSMRVFLHDLSYQQDPEGFLKRVDRFLTLADKHKIRPLLVLFDSCWYPLPYLGAQMPPRPYTHNSGWVQSPGVAALQAEGEYPRLHAYISEVVKRFANDNRIAGWDVWNEPDNGDEGTVGRPNLEPKNKVELVNKLLPQVFAWARESDPIQPLTSGVWHLGTSNELGDETKLVETERIQLENSDVISFHCYSPEGSLRATIQNLRHYGRPLLCTEYMARPFSTFNPELGIMKEEKVGAYNWGLVSGKSQTIYSWGSWYRAETGVPKVWFHDILRLDGSPYDQEEVAYIKRTTGVAN